MKLIAIVGAPRSGTTYIAQQTAKILNVNLLPEAQWIISTLLERDINEYTRENWGSTVDPLKGRGLALNRGLLIEVIKEYEKSNGLPLSDAFVEHTPQNILYFSEISQKIEFDHYIAPLRHPLFSIYSLVNQKWFSGSVYKAAIFNFRCLFGLYRHRSRIKFVDIQNDEDYIANQLRSIIGRPVGEAPYSGSNMILKMDGLKESHQYLSENGKRSSAGAIKNLGLLAKFLSIPSIFLYYFLLNKTNV